MKAAVITLFVIVIQCLGVDLRTERSGDVLTIYTTNNSYRCAIFEWNCSLEATNGWEEYHGYFAGRYRKPSERIYMRVPIDTNSPQTFWRLRDCATP